MKRTKAIRERRTRVEHLSDVEVVTIEDFRSDRRWSYRELSNAISEFLGVRMPEPTLIQALRVGSGLPTTIRPIRRYLEHVSSHEEAAAS